MLFLPFMVKDMLTVSHKETPSFGEICFKFVPCFILYSNIDNSIQLWYTISLMLFLCIGVFGFAYKWTDFLKESRREEYFGNRKYVISGMFFDCWDWDNADASDMNNTS